MNRSDLDELLSSYVDGEASPSEIARIEADPALVERAAELAAAAAAVAEPVTLPSEPAIDAAIATALDQSATASNVAALGPRRQRASRATLALAAAAAVIAGGFLAGAILLAANDDSDNTAEVADADSPESSDEAAAAIPRTQAALDAGDEATAGTDADNEAQAEQAPAEAGGLANDSSSEEEAVEEAVSEDEAVEEAVSEEAALADEAAEDDALESGVATQEFAEPAAELGSYPSLDELLTELETQPFNSDLDGTPLPCGLTPPPEAPDLQPFGATAVVGETTIAVTGWFTPDGFQTAQIRDASTCETVQLPQR